MASPSLGIKRHCQSCGNNYYDLNKLVITCPSCKTAFDPEILLKSRVNKAIPKAAVKKEEIPDVIVEIDEAIEGVDAPIDDDTDVLTDDSDLAVIAKTDSSKDDFELPSPSEAIEDELDKPEDDDS